MKRKDQLQFVIQNLKKHKIRTLMTVIATAMGCAFLIVLASVGFGLQQTVVEDTLEQQAVTEIDIHGKGKPEEGFQPLTMEHVQNIEEIDGVKAVTRRNHLGQVPVFLVDQHEGQTGAVSAHFPSEIASGMELAEGEFPEEPNEVLIGPHFSQALIPTDANEQEVYDEQGMVKEEYQYEGSLLGKTIDMKVTKQIDGEEETTTIPVEVTGILQEPTREWMQDRKVYMTTDLLDEIAAFTGTPKGSPVIGEGMEADDTISEVKVYAQNLQAVEGITEQLDEKNYATYSVVSEMNQINVLFTIAKAGLILIGTIAIVIASIGIYNTMTMAVTERAPDIGIMKAIGANPKTIKRVFLLESSLIGIAGAVIGTVTAYIVSFGVNLGLPAIIEASFGEELPEGLQFSAIPPMLIFIAVGICLIVTILSGVRPAKRATQIDVLKAMRREI
ncbi:ABC transporter permease [Lentibacillus sediminis]|uniref:ABC transporter permease n=1 Tax=Lentibacillus sediminis TaxID=1940529 RepID=UPI000C1BA8A0|nr:FtsX-like permease family protein [Lentibacillus sediminis]